MHDLDRGVWEKWANEEGANVWSEYDNRTGTRVVAAIGRVKNGNYAEFSETCVDLDDDEHPAHIVALSSSSDIPLRVQVTGEANVSHLNFVCEPDDVPNQYRKVCTTHKLSRDGEKKMFGEIVFPVDRLCMKHIDKCTVLGELTLSYIEGNNEEREIRTKYYKKYEVSFQGEAGNI